MIAAIIKNVFKRSCKKINKNKKAANFNVFAAYTTLGWNFFFGTS